MKHKEMAHEHGHMGHRKMHGEGHMSRGHSHGEYENEVEKPSVPVDGHMLAGMGCHDFKGEADPIAYGQAGGPGCKSDEGKIHGQMKQYHWD